MLTFSRFRQSKNAAFVIIVLLSSTLSLIFYTDIFEFRTSLSQALTFREVNLSHWINVEQDARTTEVFHGSTSTKTSIQQGTVADMSVPIETSNDTHTRNLGERKYQKGYQAYDQRVIRILTWTHRAWKRPLWFEGKTDGVAQCDTPIPCEFSNNLSLYNISDVILFHLRLIRTNRPMPSYRLPHQHWMTYLHESPTRHPRSVKPYDAWFNWTIAYSLNAHIARPYGMCLPNRETVWKDPSSITDAIRKVYGKRADSMPWAKRNIPYNYTSFNHAKGKTHLVLWVVSNCRTPSRRERYVKELKQHIKVEIIGGCGKKVCVANNSCLNNLFREYKFYLSFENSLCPEYITEKVLMRLDNGIVPIVLGGADYKSSLPEHSYIDVKDFASPKALAKYLDKLDNNDTLYNEYFAWKQNYTCSPLIEKDLLCDICQFMNENRNKVNVIPDVNKVWNKDSCISPAEYYSGIANI